MPSTNPQASSAYLPDCAYFPAGRGLGCDAITRALTTAGFTNITGPSDSQQASEFWITPSGGTKTEISPPGTTPKKLYDLESTIQLVGTSSARSSPR